MSQMTKSDQELPQHGHWSLADIEAHIPEEPKFWADIALRKVVEAYKSRQAQVDQLRAEVKEQCRLNGIGQERELKLITENQQLKAEVGRCNAERSEMRMQAERDAARADKNAADYSRLKAMAERLATDLSYSLEVIRLNLPVESVKSQALAEWKAFREGK
jgi:hypothetical protein